MINNNININIFKTDVRKISQNEKKDGYYQYPSLSGFSMKIHEMTKAIKDLVL